MLEARTDRQPDSCVQKQGEQDAGYHYDDKDDQQFIPVLIPAVVEFFLCQTENGIAGEQVHVGGKAHHGNIDRVKSCIDDNAGQNGGNPHSGLQKGGDKAGADACSSGGKEGKHWMPGQRYHSAYRTA